jgi:hypothetical protein
MTVDPAYRPASDRLGSKIAAAKVKNNSTAPCPNDYLAFLYNPNSTRLGLIQ